MVCSVLNLKLWTGWSVQGMMRAATSIRLNVRAILRIWLARLNNRQECAQARSE